MSHGDGLVKSKFAQRYNPELNISVWKYLKVLNDCKNIKNEAYMLYIHDILTDLKLKVYTPL